MFPLLVALIVTCVTADLLPRKPYEDFSDATIKLMADYNRKLSPIGQPNNDAFEWSKCLDIPWNACQYNFNKALGIDTSLTWRQSDELNKQINKVLNQNFTMIARTCNDFTRFYTCLGTSYYSCMDLYRLIGVKGASFQQANLYVATYRNMQFLCNAGFEEVVKDYYCMKSLEHNAAYLKCINDFDVASNQTSKLCGSVSAAMTCLSSSYGNACGTNESGWFGCESFRSSFSEICWDQRCSVGGYANF